jgi:hypothetical protein
MFIYFEKPNSNLINSIIEYDLKKLPPESSLNLLTMDKNIQDENKERKLSQNETSKFNTNVNNIQRELINLLSYDYDSIPSNLEKEDIKGKDFDFFNSSNNDSNPNKDSNYEKMNDKKMSDEKASYNNKINNNSNQPMNININNPINIIPLANQNLNDNISSNSNYNIGDNMGDTINNCINNYMSYDKILNNYNIPYINFINSSTLNRFNNQIPFNINNDNNKFINYNFFSQQNQNMPYIFSQNTNQNQSFNNIPIFFNN